MGLICVLQWWFVIHHLQLWVAVTIQQLNTITIEMFCSTVVMKIWHLMDPMQEHVHKMQHLRLPLQHVSVSVFKFSQPSQHFLKVISTVADTATHSGKSKSRQFPLKMFFLYSLYRGRM